MKNRMKKIKAGNLKNNCGSNYKWLGNQGYWRMKKKIENFIYLIILLCFPQLWQTQCPLLNKKKIFPFIHNWYLKLMKHFEWYKLTYYLLNETITYHDSGQLFKINYPFSVTRTHRNHMSRSVK